MYIRISSSHVGGHRGCIQLHALPLVRVSRPRCRHPISCAALVIAIDYPRDSAYHLPGCTRDVDTVVRGLQARGFARSDIRTLTNRHATLGRIMFELRDLVARSTSLDLIVIHFSGHGTQQASSGGAVETDGLDEVIIPWFETDDQIKSIDDNTLTSILTRTASTCKGVFTFDCCHSGTILDTPARVSHGKPLICVSACQDHEEALQIRGNGVLTSYIGKNISADGPSIGSIDQRRVNKQQFSCRVLRGACEPDHGIFRVEA